MERLTQWIVKKIFPDALQSTLPDDRSRIGYLEGWVSVAVNVVLFIIKLVLGVLSASIALIADAFHSLSDTSSSIVIIISSKIAKKPSDMEHPFGHQRAETIATIIIAMLLFVTGFELIKSAFDRIVNPSPFNSNWWIIGIIFLTVIIKELLAQFANSLGSIIQSPSLKADYWHHRADAVTTLLIVISFIFGRFGVFHLDGYVGIVVAILIMYVGYNLSKDSISHLLGEAPEPEFIDKVKKIACSVPSVSNVHDIIMHQYGNIRIISLHIEVPETLSLNQAHSIAEEVENRLRNKLKIHATVHFEPRQVHRSATDTIKHVIQQKIENDDRMESFHAFQTKGKSTEKKVRFDLVIQPNIADDEIEQIRKTMIHAVKESSEYIKQVTVKIEPSYPFRSHLQ